MMGSNLKEALLPGISPPTSSSPSATVSDDLSKTDRSSPSLSVDMAKNGASSPYSPPPSLSNASIAKNPYPPSASPPSLENANVAKNLTPPSPPSLDKANLAKNLSPSSPLAESVAEESSSDSTKPPGGIAPDCSTSQSGPALGSNAPSTVFGRQEDLESPRTALLTSPSSSSSSPPASRGWWGLRQRPLRLPVYAPAPSPPPGRSFNWFHEWKETNRPKAPPLDSVGVEKVIGVFGFSLFGSISLLPSTMDRVKSLPDPQKTSIMVGFGLIWVEASAGVLYGLHGKTEFEQAVCRHTGRLGMFGVALLVLLHVGWTLPDGIGFDIAFYSLVFVAVLLHFGSWIASCIVGEDRMEDTAPAEAPRQ